MGTILSLRRVSDWKTEDDEARRPILKQTRPFSTLFERLREWLYCTLKGVLQWIKPRKAAGPLLPIENPTPKPSDHYPPLKQALLISNSDAASVCPNIHVFSDHCPEENQEHSSETKNTNDSVTISIPSFHSHFLDSYSISSITDTDSAVFTQENASRKNVTYAEDEETGNGDRTCEESSDQCLEQNREYYPSDAKSIVYSVTISIPNFSDHALDSTASSSNDTDSAAITQENAPRKNESHGKRNSKKKKCKESAKEKKSEVEKVKESTVVVEKARWIGHYSSRHRILLVGEGDFSFSCSLAVAFGGASKMVATSLDSKAFLNKNYARAPWNIGELMKRGCLVIHGIDATTMATQQLLQNKTFDRIIYNFPFAGFFKESRKSTLWRHRSLVSLFLKNAKEMIDLYGEIHISHKTNGYHNEWNLVSIASLHGLRLIEEVKFDLRDYPGYNTKYGFGGDKNFDCNPSNTFKFGLGFV